MALTIPLVPANLAELMKLKSAPWNLMAQQELSGLGSGEGLSHDLSPALWEAECSTVDMLNDDAYGLQARFNALDGSNSTFYLSNPAKPYPRADPRGALLAAGAISGPSLLLDFVNDDAYAVSPVMAPVINVIADNRKELRISGLPSGYVLSDGDFLEVSYGSPSRRALLQIVAGLAANSGGVTGFMEVRPHMRPGLVEGLAVNVIKPAAKVKVLPATLRLESVGPMTSRLRFSVRQTLAAG